MQVYVDNGSGKPVESLLSKGNRFRIKDLTGHNQSVYFILKDQFDFSSKMGTTIHGIIGHDLLKDVIAKIDYLNNHPFPDCVNFVACSEYHLILYSRNNFHRYHKKVN